jgi:2-phosphosulfolactate phosphatase
MARDAQEVLIGSFVNIQALAEHLISQGENVVIFCAAWKSLFNLEDSVFAGALADLLLEAGFTTLCDSAHGAIDLWHRAKPDLKSYLAKSSHRNRLKHLVSDQDFEYTVTLNSRRLIPVLREDKLVLLD